jgi:hypothetical protein
MPFSEFPNNNAVVTADQVPLFRTITSGIIMTRSQVNLELARLALQEHGWALPGAVLPGCDAGPVGVRG